MLTLRTGISVLIAQLIPLLGGAQPDTSAISAPPPPAPIVTDPYSFEVADSLLRVKKFERAVWTYINLYPRSPDSVASLVRAIRPAHWDGDLPSFIQTTFARFAPMDPEIATFDFSGPAMDSVRLKIKADWSNELIRRLSSDPLQLDPFRGK